MKCPRCRTDWLGTPTEDGRRKCRNCGVVWVVRDGRRRLVWTPERGDVYRVPVSLEELTVALHLISHEKADLWPATPGCGCRERAVMMWREIESARGMALEGEGQGGV